MGGLTVGIDATNMRAGGGRTHLIELLREATPEQYGFSRVVVWGSQQTLDLLDDRPWLEKVAFPQHEGNWLSRSAWQYFRLARVARDARCDLLFVPGGTYVGSFHPVVTMSQNLLPFEWQELQRYGGSLNIFRLMLLRLTQSQTFRTADGVIFLTQYSKAMVSQVTGLLADSAIIPLGLNHRFLMPPKKQKAIETYSSDQPLRILYVSIVDLYKHQWWVVEAIAQLRQLTGWPIALDLVGPSYAPALRRLQDTIQRHDPQGRWVTYRGAIAFDQLHETYHQADLGLFASSCENMPNILTETMAAGLPVACSNRGPMPEILGDAGVYFDPEDPQSITTALQQLIASSELRTRLASASFTAAQQYTWRRCADETFDFLADVYSKYSQNVVPLA
jgi:glycosyltransferase involved in cell wall biosynthesis